MVWCLYIFVNILHKVRFLADCIFEEKSRFSWLKMHPPLALFLTACFSHQIGSNTRHSHSQWSDGPPLQTPSGSGDIVWAWADGDDCLSITSRRVAPNFLSAQSGWSYCQWVARNYLINRRMFFYKTMQMEFGKTLHIYPISIFRCLTQICSFHALLFRLSKSLSNCGEDTDRSVYSKSKDTY